MQKQNVAVRTRAGSIAVVLVAAGLFSLFLSGTSVPQTPPPPHVLPPPEMRVDVNHAKIDELLKLPGMTRTWAGRIMRFRPYRTKQDLLDQGVVSSEVYNRIKDFIIAHREKQ
jgi:DNA uptake protein ComE-like DNA-binding protein